MEKLIQGIAEFNKVAREIDNAYHIASVKMGISDSERYILYILSQQPVSQMDISNMTGLSKQTINSSVRKMINDGLLSALISFFRTFLFQIVAIFALPVFLGLNGIWFAVPCAEIMALVITFICIITSRKKYGYI